MLEAGADVNATQSQRMTALMLAAKNGNVDVVRELSHRPGIKLDLREDCISFQMLDLSRIIEFWWICNHWLEQKRMQGVNTAQVPRFQM